MKAEENYLPKIEDIDIADSMLRKDADQVTSLEAVLDQVESNFIKDGKQLEDNWREITIRNIKEIWFCRNGVSSSETIESKVEIEGKKSKNSETSKDVYKNKFWNKLDKCNSDVKELFYKIKDNFREIRQKSTDKPDYRFYKKDIFCEIVPLPRKGFLQVNLRVDSHHLSSKDLLLKEIKDPSKPGKRWLKFYLNDHVKLQEAINLINKTYDFSD